MSPYVREVRSWDSKSNILPLCRLFICSDCCKECILSNLFLRARLSYAEDWRRLPGWEWQEGWLSKILLLFTRNTHISLIDTTLEDNTFLYFLISSTFSKNVGPTPASRGQWTGGSFTHRILKSPHMQQQHTLKHGQFKKINFPYMKSVKT